MVELEDYLIEDKEVSCVTPMFSTIGPHAPGEERYFCVFFRGGGQVTLYQEASREKLVEVIKTVARAKLEAFQGRPSRSKSERRNRER